jgi:hypothetical protein
VKVDTIVDVADLLYGYRVTNPPYTPPRLIVLGTLHDLTLGGDPPLTDDGFGGAGDSGSL